MSLLVRSAGSACCASRRLVRFTCASCIGQVQEAGELRDVHPDVDHRPEGDGFVEWGSGDGGGKLWSAHNRDYGKRKRTIEVKSLCKKK